MKNYYLFLCMTFLGNYSYAKLLKSPCVLSITPEWTTLDTSDHEHQFGGKWILAGKITLKKRIKDPLALKKITLSWQGQKIESLNASLYRQLPNHTFIPIEDNLLSDGHWNNKEQTLQFMFEHKEYLNSHSIFCLVLTVPKKLEQIIKKGSFKLSTKDLPLELQVADQGKNLQFSFLTASNKTSRKKRRLNNTLIC